MAFRDPRLNGVLYFGGRDVRIPDTVVLLYSTETGRIPTRTRPQTKTQEPQGDEEDAGQEGREVDLLPTPVEPDIPTM